jgi:hypothetical protein
MRVRAYLERRGTRVHADGTVGPYLLNKHRHPAPSNRDILVSLPTTAPGARGAPRT